MTPRIKKALVICAFVFTIFYLILFFSAVLAEAIMPMVSPETDISGLKNVSFYNGALLSLISVILAVISIRQGSKSSQENAKLYKSVRCIEKEMRQLNTKLDRKYEIGGTTHVTRGKGSDKSK